MTIWFTSDHHFGHARVIEYSHRPFTSAEEMDEAFITNWNACVRPGDSVYHLGDFSFRRAEETLHIVRRLAGQKFLVRGNHDRWLGAPAKITEGWAWVGDYKEIKVGEQKIVLCHYPFLTWRSRHHGAWHLHGHSHGSLKEDLTTKRIDVGVDAVSKLLHFGDCAALGIDCRPGSVYRPISLEEVSVQMALRGIGVVDHHETRSHDE